jgi:uncharacterized protein YndB with AHSA1/START domain
MANEADNNPCDTDGLAHGFELKLERVFDAPAAAVFRAWTDAEILKQWFAPAPWTITRARVEPRPGGLFQIVMRSPDGQEFPNTGIFLEVVPDRRIITTDALTPDWKPAGQPFIVTRIDFEPLGDKRTRYTATASHWTEAAMKQHEAMGFHEGWGICADQLGALLLKSR